MSTRARILDRVRSAIAQRDRAAHPGRFGGWRPSVPAGGSGGDIGGLPGGGPHGEIGDEHWDPFEALFRASGGEVVRVPDRRAAAAWIADFSRDFASVVVGQTVPPELEPDLARASPEHAPLGISMARSGVAETGSLVMDARDGRRAQLLAPTHVVVVSSGSLHATLSDALAAMRDDLPSAIGFHSGPSKSADIGQIMVRGVHGPGRVVALVEGARPFIENAQEAIS